MPIKVRPRRSVLYMPGSNARALEKARGLDADALIFDLEDAVAPDAKIGARATIAAALAAGGYGNRELILRINAADTPWGYDDLVAAAVMPVDAVLLPKVDSAATVLQAITILNRHGASGDLPLWCMMETPLGILRAVEIASAHPRVAGFVMGTSDLVKDLHARHVPDRAPLLTSLGLCVLAAKAHGLAILDGVHLDLDDTPGFEAICRQGQAMGFDGKTLIHPKTIETANAVFAPAQEELEQAHKIIAAFEAAEAEGKGVVVVDGRLVEQLHVNEARRLIALANMIAESFSAQRA